LVVVSLVVSNSAVDCLEYCAPKSHNVLNGSLTSTQRHADSAAVSQVNERKKQLCTIIPKAPSRFSEFSLNTRQYALHVKQSSLLPVCIKFGMFCRGFSLVWLERMISVCFFFADRCAKNLWMNFIKTLYHGRKNG